MVLDQLGALLLDDQRAGAEVGVVVVGDLRDDRLDRLGLDAGLGGVVDAAGQVAVGRDLDGGGEQATRTCQSSVRRCCRWVSYASACDTTPRVGQRRTGTRRPARDTAAGVSRGCVGDSMRPTLRPGDRLLRRLPPRRRVRATWWSPGCPTGRSRSSGRPSGVRPSWASPAGGCSATTPTRASDSRHRGAVADEDVLAVVVAGSGRCPRRLDAVPDSTGA